MHGLEWGRGLRQWCFGLKPSGGAGGVRADEGPRGQKMRVQGVRGDAFLSLSDRTHAVLSELRMSALSHLHSLCSSPVHFSHIVSFARLFSFGILCANKELKAQWVK